MEDDLESNNRRTSISNLGIKKKNQSFMLKHLIIVTANAGNSEIVINESKS